MVRYGVLIVKTVTKLGTDEPLPLGIYRSLVIIVDADNEQEAFIRAEEALLIEPSFYEMGHVRIVIVEESLGRDWILKNKDIPKESVLGQSDDS